MLKKFDKIAKDEVEFLHYGSDDSEKTILGGVGPSPGRAWTRAGTRPKPSKIIFFQKSQKCEKRQKP